MGDKFIIVCGALLLFGALTIEHLYFGRPIAEVSKPAKAATSNQSQEFIHVPKGCTLVIVFDGYGGSKDTVECPPTHAKK